MKAWIGALALGMFKISVPARADEATSAAVEQASVSLPPNAYIWNDAAAVAEPVTIVVSIPDQRAYVYRGTALVAATTVSTGRGGRETPVGNYTILQKKVDHKSSLYNDAPMPFMQRLTWDGIAIHAGKNPGFPNSHGCIRVPAAFARKLFAVTELGTTVTVTNEATVYWDTANLVPDDVQAARGWRRDDSDAHFQSTVLSFPTV